MPCNSDHMQASDVELELSRVMFIHDQLDGKSVRRHWWSGYHPDAYKKATREKLSIETRRLCSRLQAVESVGGLSLEAQAWWRDHIEHDRKRVEAEAAAAQTEAERAGLLARLTPHERKLLGW